MLQIAERAKPAARNIERIKGHYRVYEVPYGKVYRWCPECVVVECDCGERLTLTSLTICDGCGADHEAVVMEELAAGRLGDEALHPWRYANYSEDAGLPF